MALPMLAAAVPGLIQAGASLFGAKARRREQKEAQAQFDMDQAAVRNFQFTNPNRNLENTAEDLTVNQQATNVQRAAQDASLSQGLDAIVAGGGGGGGATAIANAALGANQGLSADLARQESGIQQQIAQQAASNQAAEVQGELALQQQQHGQLQQNFGQSGQRLSAANAARQQAKQALVSGLASAAGGALGAAGGGAGAAAGGAGGAADFSQFTQAGGGLNFDPSSPFPRNGDGPPTIGEYDKKTGKFAGLDEFRGRTGQINTGFSTYQNLRNLYGDEGFNNKDIKKGIETGEHTSRLLGDEYKLAKEEFVAKGGDPKNFSQVWGERDTDLGNQYIQAQLARRQRVADDQAAWRQGQHDAWNALDQREKRENLSQLENIIRKNPELHRQLTGDTAAAAAGKGVFKQHFQRGGGASKWDDIDDAGLDNILHGLEKAGVNPKEYLRFLTPKNAPTKRTPFYRTKWMGTSKY